MGVGWREQVCEKSHVYERESSGNDESGLLWLKKTLCVEGKEKEREGPWEKKSTLLGKKF